jgi:hypothetical protein
MRKDTKSKNQLQEARYKALLTGENRAIRRKSLQKAHLKAQQQENK